MTSKELVLLFWQDMQSNDFFKASERLSESFAGYWPQSTELIIGRNNFAQINSCYPANGIWLFDINSILAEENQVVTDVSITDGVQNARVITFHVVENDLIIKQVEFWPDPFEAPKWRSKWVKKVDVGA